jgi:hypothetical protein
MGPGRYELAEAAEETTIPREELRALLQAAWKGRGYAIPPANVSDFVQAQNSNWARPQGQNTASRITEAKRPELRVVKGDKEDDQ